MANFREFLGRKTQFLINTLYIKDPAGPPGSKPLLAQMWVGLCGRTTFFEFYNFHYAIRIRSLEVITGPRMEEFGNPTATEKRKYGRIFLVAHICI